MTPEETPLVSVVMPVYNAGRFIADAIRSVLAQTYPHWELWIIDDASTDNTALVVQSFEDGRIRYLRVERIGSPSGARNAGLRRAQGALVAFLDADDLYFPDALETLVTPLIQNPVLTATYGFAQTMDETGNPLPERDMPLRKGASVTWEKIAKGDISCQLPALMLRRETLTRVGLFNEDLCGPEDYEYYVRLFLDCFEGVSCLPQHIYRYRIHSASLTKTPRHYAAILKDCIKIADWLFNHPALPVEIEIFKSQAYCEAYRYLARERLLSGQSNYTREIAQAAWQDRHIQKIDWAWAFLPLILRSFLPESFNTWMVQVKSKCIRL